MNPDFPNNLPPLEEITRLFAEDYPMPDLEEDEDDLTDDELIELYIDVITFLTDSIEITIAALQAFPKDIRPSLTIDRLEKTLVHVRHRLAGEIREISDKTDE